MQTGIGSYLVLVAQLDGAAAVLGQEDGVADVDADGDQVAVLVTGARADRDDLTLVQLVLGLLRDVEARRGFLAVPSAQWFHGHSGTMVSCGPTNTPSKPWRTSGARDRWTSTRSRSGTMRL